MIFANLGGEVGCWPEKAQQRVEVWVGENGNANSSREILP